MTSENYNEKVKSESIDFIQNNEDDLKEAIIEDTDFDRNDIETLDENFHCDIVDKEYSLSEAAFIIENSSEEETDSGLWESLSLKKALSCKAAFTFGNDVWFKCEEIYNEIKSGYETVYGKQDEIADNEEPLTEKEIIDSVWEKYWIDNKEESEV